MLFVKLQVQQHIKLHMSKAEAKTKHKGERSPDSNIVLAQIRPVRNPCGPDLGRHCLLSGSHVTDCVCLPAHATFTSGDTHSLCVVCLGAKHAESALEGADCPHCEWLPLRTLRSPKALFEEGDFTSVPRGAGPAFAEAEQRLRSWESQMDQVEGMKTGESLSFSFPIRSSAAL